MASPGQCEEVALAERLVYMLAAQLCPVNMCVLIPFGRDGCVLVVK